MERLTNEPPCIGIVVYRYNGTFSEKITLTCLGHDQYGNHLVRDPDTGGERWTSR